MRFTIIYWYGNVGFAEVDGTVVHGKSPSGSGDVASTLNWFLRKAVRKSVDPPLIPQMEILMIF